MPSQGGHNHLPVPAVCHQARMTGAFSIIVMVTWVMLGTATTTGFLAVRSSLLWPGIALAILAVIGLFGGFGFDYLAGHKR